MDKIQDKVAFLEAVLALTPCHVYWKDTNGVFLGANNNNAKFVKLKSAKDIVGKTLFDLFPPDIAKRLDDTDQSVVVLNKPLELTETVYDEYGNISHYLTNKVPLNDDHGKVIGMVGISIDITKEREREEALLKAKEAAEAANKAKSDFLANMSHELRTPLNGILGMAQLLSYSSELNEEDKIRVADLISSGKILLDLINDVLNFSKVEAGKIELQSLRVDLPHLVAEVIKTLSSLAHSKKLILENRYAENCPRLILGDPLRLRQIITNLLGNAIKFTESGRVTVSVELISQEDERAILQIAVEDTGCGIPADHLDSVFERFHQVNPSYVSTRTGTGLGLAIVKRLVEDMGGHVRVNSHMGKGSTFYFTLPCVVYQGAVSELPEKALPFIPKKKSTEKQLRILLVEDNPLNQKVAIHMFTLLFDCHIVVAKTGQEAIAMFNHDFNIVFLDVGLPDISGFEVAEALNKRMQSEGFSVPLVSMTAHADVEEGHAMYDELKFSAALTKPIDIQLLGEVLERFC